MAIPLERSSLFGSPFRAHFWPIFGPILGSILVRFAVLGPERPITTGGPFSSRKHEDFAKVLNKILEFYRSKRLSIRVLSRRNRTDFSQEKIDKNLQFSILFGVRCEKSNGFLINELERCSKTH